MKAKSGKSLTYIEETRKQHKIIGKVARKSTTEAVKLAHSQSVPVTYLKGKNIITENSKGDKVVIGTVEHNRRKVEVGAKTKLSKK